VDKDQTKNKNEKKDQRHQEDHQDKNDHVQEIARRLVQGGQVVVLHQYGK
jgi:tRNA1(Val) A37 N6-methylase TrmN6